MIKTKVTAIGNSSGIIIPNEILTRLNIEKGDTLCVIESENGFEIIPYNPEIEKEIDAARNVASRYRTALRELAK